MIKLLRYLNPYKWLLVLVFILAIVQSIANLYLPTLMADIVNKGIATFDTPFIWKTGILMAIIAILGTVCAVVGIYYSSQIATGMCTLIRADIFKKVQQFSLHEFDMISTASLITRTTNDTNQI